MSTPIPPARDMQRRPGKETGLVQNKGDDDKRHKGEGGVPDDVPHHANIGPLHDAGQQRHQSAAERAPADAQPLGLPDHQNKREDENGQSRHAVRPRFRGCSG